MTKVVNKKNQRFDVYIGRGSTFGNPYVIGKDGTREEVIEKYRKWFYKKLNNDRFRKEVEALRDKKLGCFCKPLACHGDVIVEYLENCKMGCLQSDEYYCGIPEKDAPCCGGKS